jgi:aminoglycoside/choline kinase family phosphotransferase
LPSNYGSLSKDNLKHATFLKGMHDYDDSKFKTMIHWDLWTTQIMYSHNEDGSPKQVEILDFQTLSAGHPASDIWRMVYSATDSNFRKNHFEDCLKSYFSILSGYMAPLADVATMSSRKKLMKEDL